VTGRKLHVNKYCQLFAAIKIKAHLKTSWVKVKQSVTKSLIDITGKAKTTDLIYVGWKLALVIIP
jgi:hypothetical protein